MTHTDFMISLLALKRTPDDQVSLTQNTLIYDARNIFAVRAIEGGFDRVLFIDSDMVFKPDLLERLGADMDRGLDYVSALFFSRQVPTNPLIYKAIHYGPTDDGFAARTEHYTDYPHNQLFRVAGSGTGAVLIRTDLLRRVWEAFGPPFLPLSHLGEDLSFCKRVTDLGGEMWCDSSVKVGHIGNMVFGEEVWMRQKEAQT